MIPGIRLDTNPTLACGTEEDPTACSSLYKRWVCYGVWSFDHTMANDTRIMHCDVTPSLLSLAHGGSGSSGRFMSTAGYIGLPFEFWRGDMEFEV